MATRPPGANGRIALVVNAARQTTDFAALRAARAAMIATRERSALEPLALQPLALQPGVTR